MLALLYLFGYPYVSWTDDGGGDSTGDDQNAVFYLWPFLFVALPSSMFLVVGSRTPMLDLLMDEAFSMEDGGE